MSYFGQKEYYLEIAKGNVPKHSIVNKFGHNPTSGAGEDVWGGGGRYIFYPTAAVAVDIVSTIITDDVVGGTGAMTVTVIGLDENWEQQEETVDMSGTTPVQLTLTYIRLYRAFVRIAGVSETNEGDITVYARANGSGLNAGDVGVFINAGGGQTQQTIYTVPANTNAYFVKGYVGLATSAKTAENGIFRWMLRVNAFGPGGAWLVQGEMGLVNLGNSHWQYEYGAPAGAIPEKSDIRIELTEASATFDTVGGYDLILVED